jgi:hypothetical protein
MTHGADCDDAPRDPAAPAEPLTPKRGAFPTPRSEIEKATPYVPDADQAEEGPEQEPDPTEDEDGEQRRQ